MQPGTVLSVIVHVKKNLRTCDNMGIAKLPPKYATGLQQGPTCTAPVILANGNSFFKRSLSSLWHDIVIIKVQLAQPKQATSNDL